MMEVRCKERLEQARAFADGLGPDVRAQLEDKLSYLERYRDGTCLCDLYTDFAPHSFGFTIYGPVKENGKRDHWLTGGLIFYQPSDTGVGGPQFSVRLGAGKGRLSPERPHWEIHT